MPAGLAMDEPRALAGKAGQQPERAGLTFALGEVTAGGRPDQSNAVARTMAANTTIRTVTRWRETQTMATTARTREIVRVEMGTLTVPLVSGVMRGLDYR